MIYTWITDNYIEVFGAITGIIYVFLEIRQNRWLWPLGLVTSAVYIWVFFTGRLYADMSLQAYYVAISILGWYWWVKGRGQGEGRGAGSGEINRIDSPMDRSKGEIRNSDEKSEILSVSRLRLNAGIILLIIFLLIYTLIWFILSRFTDSPVPVADAFITALSVIATWMLARKIYEHWYLWIVVNLFSSLLFLSRGLYPTMILYIVYCVMSFAGLKEWKKSLYSVQSQQTGGPVS